MGQRAVGKGDIVCPKSTPSTHHDLKLCTRITEQLCEDGTPLNIFVPGTLLRFLVPAYDLPLFPRSKFCNTLLLCGNIHRIMQLRTRAHVSNDNTSRSRLIYHLVYPIKVTFLMGHVPTFLSFLQHT